MSLAMKKCNGPCGEEKLVEFHFYKVKRVYKDGTVRYYPRSWCKDCEKERIKGVKERNPALRTWKPKTEEQREKIRTYQREYYRTTYGKGSHTWSKYPVKSTRKKPRIDAAELIKWFDDRPWTITRMSETNRRSLLRIREEGTVTEQMADILLTDAGEPDQLFAVLGEEAA